MTPPERLDFDALPPRRTAAGARVEIIVPVYAGRRETLTALHRVLSAQTRIAYRLTVVNDASPDPELSHAMARLGSSGRINLIVNPSNLGFAGAVNCALAGTGSRDVVLLNADTEVYHGWLDRLARAARTSPRTGTATPLSNAASILSYPTPCRDNPVPAPGVAERIDQIAARLRAAPVTIPTGVGFCMYIRRACLDQVGGFDAAAFPRGYGEENDFCLRASAKGWRHVAAADTFVLHHGAVSFGAARAGLIRDALAILDQRYPDYRRRVGHFISADPLRGARGKLCRSKHLARASRRKEWFVYGRSAAETIEGPLNLSVTEVLFKRTD